MEFVDAHIGLLRAMEGFSNTTSLPATVKELAQEPSMDIPMGRTSTAARAIAIQEARRSCCHRVLPSLCKQGRWPRRGV